MALSKLLCAPAIPKRPSLIDMPEYKPSILLSDAFGSTKDFTWFHRNGKCFIKNRFNPGYTLTPARKEYLDVHRRALAAWREQEHSAQLLWNEYARSATSHRPPFDNKAYISGQNLFVSAYHGFYTLGNERIPDPLPFGPFPVVAMTFSSAEEPEEGTLHLKFRTICSGTDVPERYRILMKLQLTHPGGGKRSSLLRNVLARDVCKYSSGIVGLLIPDFREKWKLDNLPGYGAHGRYVVLDTASGYRDQYRDYDFSFDLPQR